MGEYYYCFFPFQDRFFHILEDAQFFITTFLQRSLQLYSKILSILVKHCLECVALDLCSSGLCFLHLLDNFPNFFHSSLENLGSDQFGTMVVYSS